MGTNAEEIFSQKLKRVVHAGEIVLAEVDFIMSHDSTTPLAIEALEEIGKPLFVPDRIIIHFDHFYPSPNINCSILHQRTLAFVRKEGIKNSIGKGSVIRLWSKAVSAIYGKFTNPRKIL